MRRNYALFQVPLGVQLRQHARPVRSATHGIRAALTLTPTYSLASGGAPNSHLRHRPGHRPAPTSTSATGWPAPRGAASWRCAALVGAVSGAGVFDIPPDQRFYAGGGGTHARLPLPVGRAEIRRRPADRRQPASTSAASSSASASARNWGAVAFVDAGQVGDRGVPFNGAGRVGAGVGVRYYTPIGPDPRRCGGAADARAQGRRVRALYRHRAGVLMRRAFRDRWLGGWRPGGCWSCWRWRWCWSG